MKHIRKDKANRRKGIIKMNFFMAFFKGLYPPERIRGLLCYWAGITTDRKIRLKKHVFFEHPSGVHIGNGCLINHYVGFYTGRYGNSHITIGNNVAVSMGTKFITNSHEIGFTYQRAGAGIAESIIVEDGVWIASNVTILKGVKIGHGG
ncbi:acyltransferase [Butyrivibrio sp. NC2002]|uniref:acyltransferase n=1 Tax=Butyrivibrio sp. NC2002 TaxID=1410610 RepID=UPI00068E8D65|nr:hypothetical protein [Butyrivibrio sp. NC2002]